MSEKVLGFKEKDAVKQRALNSKQEFVDEYSVEGGKLVPVVLLEKYEKVKKELAFAKDVNWSILQKKKVTVEWLEGFCKKRFSGCNQNINDLLKAVKEEVKKE